LQETVWSGYLLADYRATVDALRLEKSEIGGIVVLDQASPKNETLKIPELFRLTQPRECDLLNPEGTQDNPGPSLRVPGALPLEAIVSAGVFQQSLKGLCRRVEA